MACFEIVHFEPPWCGVSCHNTQSPVKNCIVWEKEPKVASLSNARSVEASPGLGLSSSLVETSVQAAEGFVRITGECSFILNRHHHELLT